MHEAVSAAWDKVTEDWDNQARHDALLALAVEHQAFKWVATKYRERKGDAIADAQLAKIGAAAMATMLSAATAKRESDVPSPYKRALLWIVVLAALMVFGLMAVKLMANAHHAPPP